MDMQLPTTATEFLAFMNRVWEIRQEPAEGGGVVLFASPDYDRWHDALVVARACGLVKCGPTIMDADGEPGYVFRFPGALDGVRINRTGDCVAPSRLRRVEAR